MADASVHFLAAQMFIGMSLFADSGSRWLGCIVLAIANIIAQVFAR